MHIVGECSTKRELVKLHLHRRRGWRKTAKEEERQNLRSSSRKATTPPEKKPNDKQEKKGKRSAGDPKTSDLRK